MKSSLLEFFEIAGEPAQ